MAEKEAKRVKPADSVDLNVKISEGSDGSLNVGYSAYTMGTDPPERFHPRPSHVVGMLVCAAIFVIMENFDALKAELNTKLSREEKDIDPRRKPK